MASSHAIESNPALNESEQGQGGHYDSLLRGLGSSLGKADMLVSLPYGLLWIV